MDWPKLINETLERRGLSVRALAVELGISDVFLGAVRKGAQPASPMLKFKLLDMLGYDMTRDVLLKLLPDEVANSIHKKEIERGQKRATKASEGNSKGNSKKTDS